MNALHLNFYGTSVRLDSEAAGVLIELRRDFERFSAAPVADPDVLWELHLRGAEPASVPGPLRWNGFAAGDRGGIREVLYEDGAVARLRYATERGELYCADPARLRELAYLAVLSRAGEAMDRRGFHRVHALGFEKDGSTGLVLLPSGGGKSVLALELLRRGVKVLSDDTPVLTRDGRALPFPLRLGFRSREDAAGVPEARLRAFPRRRFGMKWLVDWDDLPGAPGAGGPVRWLFAGERGAAPFIEPARAAAAAALLEGLVVGRGVAQMAEYMLRPTPRGALVLARIAASRTVAAYAALRAPSFRFRLGPDAPRNADLLLRFLADGALL